MSLNVKLGCVFFLILLLFSVVSPFFSFVAIVVTLCELVCDVLITFLLGGRCQGSRGDLGPPTSSVAFVIEL